MKNKSLSNDVADHQFIGVKKSYECKIHDLHDENEKMKNVKNSLENQLKEALDGFEQFADAQIRK